MNPGTVPSSGSGAVSTVSAGIQNLLILVPLYRYAQAHGAQGILVPDTFSFRQANMAPLPVKHAYPPGPC